MQKRLLAFVTGLSALCLTACVTHVHSRYPTWQAYQQAHPNARFVVVHTRPAPQRTCWEVRRGWRCVVH